MNVKSVTPVRWIGRCFTFLAWPVLAWAASDYPAPYSFTLLAGVSSIGSTDGSRNIARFFGPQGIAVDGAGNLYVADAGNSVIRKITPAGVVSTLAGVPGYPGSSDGSGRTARFDFPEGLAIDAAGNLYVADAGNHTIRKISPGGAVSTVAGLPGAPGSADGRGSAARFNWPSGVAVDAAGNLYVADDLNHTVRKINPAGDVTTLAGLAGYGGSVDGIGSAARLSQVSGIAVDAVGNVYVTSETAVRKITPACAVTTLAGISPGGFTGAGFGSADGPGGSARFSYPKGLAVDLAGNVYVADRNNSTIRKITPAGDVTTLAGTAPVEGDLDGPGSAARFCAPEGIAVDPAGNLYVADTGNNTIRKITAGGIVSTVAGLSLFQSRGSADGRAAKFYGSAGVAVDTSGNVYVADTSNHTIRKITPDGVVTTLAGTAGSIGSTDGPGRAARFSYPAGVAVDGTGNIYVADSGNHTIRKITAASAVTTLAGTAEFSGSTDGPGSAARFKSPRGVAVDTSGNVYVADSGNHTIRKIRPDGVVSTLAGLAEIFLIYDPSTGQPIAGANATGDGTGSAARFFNPEGVAVDGQGRVYVADAGNNAIRKITPTGVVTTLAGMIDPWSWGQPGSTDGLGTAARFFGPRGVAVDESGNVYVTDTSNSTIRKITPDGAVTTLAGLAGASGSADGTGSEARFNQPLGVAVDAAGKVYVSCSSPDSNTIRQGQLAGPPVITIQPQSQTLIAGGSVQFSVTASGAPAPTYQWFFNGSPFSGATNNTLSFTNARAADAGDYTVVVTNELGTVTSNKATLTFTAAPTTPASSSGGGGGAIDAWFCLALFALGAVRHLTARRLS